MTSLETLIQVQKKIAPELIEILETRYTILRAIRMNQPIGRRILAAKVGLGERVLRGETGFLRRQELIESHPDGMRVTAEGEEVLAQLEDFIRELRGLARLEKRLSQLFGLRRVMVVPGNSDRDAGVKREMGRAVARYLREHLAGGMVVAVAGGTTMAEVAEAIPGHAAQQDVLVVPARGGLGEEVEIQANTIAARLAKKLGASYRLLHAPDNLSAETMASLAGEPLIREVVSLIKRADILLHGIGRAEEMARRRGLDPAEWKRLKENGAVAEAFGYYFDARGRIVHATPSIGISLEDMAGIAHVVAVAGGESKAEAIIAVVLSGYQHVLVTDEAAARRILELLAHRESSPRA